MNKEEITILIIGGITLLFMAVITFSAVIGGITENISIYSFWWSTRDGNKYSSLELKRVKFFNYYYIVENKDYATCSSHPDYENGIKHLKAKIREHKNKH